jgi:hypothetical protein
MPTISMSARLEESRHVTVDEAGDGDAEGRVDFTRGRRLGGCGRGENDEKQNGDRGTQPHGNSPPMFDVQPMISYIFQLPSSTRFIIRLTKEISTFL